MRGWEFLGKRKLNKELPKAGFILADVGIDLTVSALEVSVAHDGRATVPGAGDVNHLEIVFFDDPVRVHVNEVLPRGRAPVSQKHVLHKASRYETPPAFRGRPRWQFARPEK
jgi:hypothetical protein